MKLKTLAKNQTLLIKDNSDEIFFSYETPVAGRILNQYVKADKKWSTTTTRHINDYLAGKDANLVKPKFFDTI